MSFSSAAGQQQVDEPLKPLSKQIKRLITHANVRNELVSLDCMKDMLEQDIDTIVKDASRLFAILAILGMQNYIKKFLDEKINDGDLPLVEVKTKPSSTGIRLDLGNRRGEPITAMKDMSDIGTTDVYSKQWCVLAPVFDTPWKHYDLKDDCILPFVEDNEYNGDGRKSGGFSDVWTIRIHYAHQSIYMPNSEKEPLIAVKRCHSMQRDDFDKEAGMLKAIAQMNHPHIIKLLMTYFYKGKYHLLFPYAASNLEDYWKSRKVASWDCNPSHWAIEQMKGLASGLNKVHNFSVRQSLRPEPVSTNADFNQVSGSMLTVAVEPEAMRYGRHGDIKPENILWFKESDDGKEGGILKITDFGLSKFHGRQSRSAVEAAKAVASPIYEAPEIALNHPVSRAYDIWSLGCVFLEFITWRLGGSGKVRRFRSYRDTFGGDSTTNAKFFTIVNYRGGTNESAVVRNEVSHWIEHLLQHPRCSNLTSTYDLLVLVRDQMLVVQKSERISSGDLETRLYQIQEKARGNKSYLLGQATEEALSAWESQEPRSGLGVQLTPDLRPPVSSYQSSHDVGRSSVTQGLERPIPEIMFTRPSL